MGAEDAANEIDSNAKENGLKEMASVEDEEEDDLAVDPFQHKLELSTAQWIQTILLGVILVPIRLILIVFFMVLLWIISSVSLRVVAKGKYTLISIFSVFDHIEWDTRMYSINFV